MFHEGDLKSFAKGAIDLITTSKKALSNHYMDNGNGTGNLDQIKGRCPYK